MKRLAVIDIGSNSFRLVLYEISEGGSFKIMDALKESVRLGADILNGNVLTEERMSKAINTLKSFKNLCESANTSEIIAVATEAVRKASNGNNFIKRIYETIGIKVRILSGDEEVFYDHLGVKSSLYIDNSLMIDMGGSSTEIAWLCGEELKESAILPFGAVSLTENFEMSDLINPLKEDALKSFLSNEYNKIPWLFNVHFDNIIGIGGTIRNIGKIDRINKRYALDLHHNYQLSDIDVHTVYNTVKSKNLRQRSKVEGLSKDRADIFVAPVCAVYTLMNLLEINNLTVSGKGLREGLLYEYITNNYRPIENILDFSITNVMLNRNLNITHAGNVYKTTKLLFEKLRPLHHLDSSYDRCIKTAAMLHDSGLNVRFYDHHRHSFYMILNSEIYGLSHKELIMSAYMAAYHENTLFESNIFQYHGIINKLDLIISEKVGILLRIAECLDKNMSGDVKDIDCTIENDVVTLKIISDENVDLEINYAQRCSDFFFKIYDKHLIVN